MVIVEEILEGTVSSSYECAWDGPSIIIHIVAERDIGA